MSVEFRTKEHVYEAMAAQCRGNLYGNCWVADAQEYKGPRTCRLVDILCIEISANDWRKLMEEGPEVLED